MRAATNIRRLTPSEDDIALAVGDWVKRHESRWKVLKLYFHVKNEGRQSWIGGKAMKRKGVRKGMPDCNLPVALGGFSGWWCELKAGDNRPTLEQLEVIGWLHGTDHFVCVCDNEPDCTSLLQRYLEQDPLLRNYGLPPGLKKRRNHDEREIVRAHAEEAAKALRNLTTVE